MDKYKYEEKIPKISKIYKNRKEEEFNYCDKSSIL